MGYQLTIQAGSVVVSHVSSVGATWSCLILLLSIHLAMNHAAVRSVSMRSLNRQRANLVLSSLIQDDRTLTPQTVSQHERIFEWDGVLRWKGSAMIGKAHIGVTIQTMLGVFASAQHSTTGATDDADRYLKQITDAFRQEDFLFWWDPRRGVGYIVLKEGVTPETQLKAWALALWVGHRLRHATAAGMESESAFTTMKDTLIELTKRWEGWVEKLKVAGWETQVGSLETVSGTRIRLVEEK